MRINLFVDTEFTNFSNLTMQLISLGIVSEDGKHEFYRENSSHLPEFRSDFVEKIVIPLLERGEYEKAYPWLCLDLKEWIDQLPCDEVCFIVDYVGDWHLLSDALSKHEQSKKVSCLMYSAAFLQALLERGIHTESKIDDAYRALMYSDEDSYYLQDPRQHHALVDAKSNRHAWLRGLGAVL